jgi:hypothetical protein
MIREAGWLLTFIGVTVSIALIRRALLARESVRKITARTTSVPHYAEFRMTEEIQDLVHREPSLDALLSERSRTQAETLVSVLSRVMSREISAEVMRILPVLLLLGVYFCTSIILFDPPASPATLISFAAVLFVLQCLAAARFFLLQSYDRIPLLVLTLAATVLLPLSFALLLSDQTIILYISAFVILGVFSFMPLSLRHVLLLTFFLGSLCFLSFGVESWIAILALLIFGTFVGVVSELHARSIRYAGITLSLSRVLALYESTSLLLVLRWCARQVAGGAYTELVLDDGRRVPDPLVERKGEAEFSELRAKLPRLSEWLIQLDREGGVLDLSAAPSGVSREWEICLGGSARSTSFCFAALEVVLRGEKRTIFLLTVLPRFCRFFGREAIFRMFFAIAKLVDARQRITQSQFRSSDLVTALQSSLERRERDLRELIHYSNNMAHEASLVEERFLETGEEKNVHFLRQIAQASARLSSDLKVLWEFSHRPSAFSLEWTAAESIKEEIVDFIDFQAKRSNRRFELLWELEPDDSLESPGGDVLLSAIRQSLRGYLFSNSGEGTLSVQVERTTNAKARISVFDQSAALPRAEYSSQVKAHSDDGQFYRDDLLGVFRSLGERLGFPLHESAAGIRLDLNLSKVVAGRIREEQGRIDSSHSSGWLLFVDDSPNALKLYDQIGKQLGLRYMLASGTDDVRRLIGQHGLPSFIVSDEELGDNSGSAFLRELETEFEIQFPGYLVTGQEVSQALKARIPDRMKLLSKPIGRKKLLEELENATRAANVT